MTSAHGGANSPEGPGGSTAAGASPQGVEATRSTTAVEAPSTLHDLEEAVHQLEHDAEHRPPPAGRTTNLVVAALVVALGAAALVGSLSLGAGSARTPGSGTWPLILSLLLICLGLGLAVTARSTHDAERFSRSSLLVLVGLATMVGFVALIGSFACVPLVYIYPPFLHLRGVAETRGQKAFDIGLMLVGIFGMVFSTAVTLLQSFL